MAVDNEIVKNQRIFCKGSGFRMAQTYLVKCLARYLTCYLALGSVAKPRKRLSVPRAQPCLRRRSVLVTALAGSRAHPACHCGYSCPVPCQSWFLVLLGSGLYFVLLFIMFTSCLLHGEYLSMAQNSESVQ